MHSFKRPVRSADGNSSPSADDAASLEASASNLVNPASGVANDYLNHFNEILLLIENLPIMLPEMVDEILQWRPKSYQEYFQNSPLPGSAEALRIYDTLPDAFRRDFEAMIGRLDSLALESIAVIGAHRGPDGEIAPEKVEDFCARTSVEMRAMLARTADLVNHGHAMPAETPQGMADRLLNSTTGRD